MNKEIRTVDAEKGIVQITTVDERWYAVTVENKKTGLPEYVYFPSVTWIAGYYPKGIGFFKWLADKGWDEAQAIKESAGNKGSRVHHCISDLINGEVVNLEAQYPNEGGEMSVLTMDEYECVASFARWAEEAKPTFLRNEYIVVSRKHNFAGTVDLLCEIDGEKWLIDFKTSQNVWASHRIQISAYGETQKVDKLGILQIGYKRNKKGFKFNEIEPCFDLFQASQLIWKAENPDTKPKQKDLPLEIKLDEGMVISDGNSTDQKESK